MTGRPNKNNPDEQVNEQVQVEEAPAEAPVVMGADPGEENQEAPAEAQA